MSKIPSVLGIITARGGSKGIPNKNIAPLCGKPLLAYTIEATKCSKLLTRTIISTDSAEIAAIAKKHGAEVPFMRPAELSTDEALALDVLAHAIRHAKDQDGQSFDYVMMLQPTSPLRTGEDIDACIRLAAETDADSVFSMKELPDFAPQKIKTIENGEIKPFIEDEQGQSAPRHKGKKAYKRNCAIYLTKTELILKGDQFGKKSMAYVMPQERSIDINDPVDLELAEFWMKKTISSNT
ncbi:MAG: N-acylneuraminate cytidylyltransferase [Candidatus Peregrinibacteria bacterium Greene0416_62]|nr:MAG: N-acylneuraminate cytidylyltransferase [Candidatus Peregrinibacteria bacterium Greene0416_62]TSC98587.1 MAG: N-acylneuraminate cytidylyltransferase [Candidatus Peregrinibacteria bacterium Greene1014_49]